MSIFDENIITVNDLLDIGFSKSMKPNIFTMYGNIIKVTITLPYMIYIENIAENDWSVNIYIHDYYVQYSKNIVVSDMLTVRTILHGIQNITYDELYNEFQIVTVC